MNSKQKILLNIQELHNNIKLTFAYLEPQKKKRKGTGQKYLKK